MTEKKKPIGELRRELQHLILDLKVSPSTMKNRGDIEQLIGVYSKFTTEKKALPPTPRGVGGRKKPVEVDAEKNDEGIAIPKKLNKVKTEYAERKEKKAVKPTAPVHVEEDSGTGSESEAEAEERKAKKTAVAPAEKPKRVITPEHLAKMKAGRLAKKSDASGEPKPAEPKPAEPKKETPPPDAPGYNKLPVRKLD